MGVRMAVGWLVLAGMLAAPAWGDSIIRKDGKVLSGRVVAETETDVTLQTRLEALTVNTKVARKDIAEIRKDALAENRYCRIPIHGEIGKDVRAEWLAQALRDVADLHPNYLVLDIDSPGGQLAEMARIVDLLARQTSCRLVAHVHRAHSAAAMIALACPTIVVDSHAQIGSAVPWTPDIHGLPKDVEAKQFAAFVAAAKAMADMGHHSPLLARGMIEMDLALSLVRREGEANLVVEGTPEGSAPFKKPGTILCMSTSEALQCGLALGEAETPGELRKVLGLPDWQAVGETAWSYLEGRGALVHANASKAATSKARSATLTLVEVESRLKKSLAARDEASQRAGALPVEMNAELARIDPKLTPAQHDARTIEIRARYEREYADAINSLNRADFDIKQLQKLKADLSKSPEE